MKSSPSFGTEFKGSVSIPTTLELYDHLSQRHSEGYLALHITPNPSANYGIFDDRCILNNLREDGGTTERKADYQLYTQISATVLPKAEYMGLRQNLYLKPNRNDLFIGLDLVKSNKIIGYHGIDAHVEYHTNKKGRPSYGYSRFDLDYTNAWSEKSHSEKLTLLRNKDDLRTRAATTAKVSLFGTIDPSYCRAVNEVVLKTNIDTLVCLGAIAPEPIDFLKFVPMGHPHYGLTQTECEDLFKKEEAILLLELIFLQKQMQEHLGINYPIVLYNNSNKKIKLNFVGSAPQEIGINSFICIDAEIALKQIMRYFPDGIKIKRNCLFLESDNPDTHLSIKKDFCMNLLKMKCNEAGELIFKKESEFQDELSQRRKQALESVDSALKKLSDALISYKTDDKILKIHKQDKKNASPLDQYEEIDQSALKMFIRKIFGKERPESDAVFTYLLKAYNLQFRLSVYKKLLLNTNSIVNYTKLKEDLSWCEILLNKPELRSKLTPAVTSNDENNIATHITPSL